MDREPYIPLCSWCEKPYTECKCGMKKALHKKGF